jgi:hypothetical protein
MTDYCFQIDQKMVKIESYRALIDSNTNTI